MSKRTVSIIITFLGTILLVPILLYSDTGEFLVNTYTLDRQTLPAIAMDNNGAFVITWVRMYQDEDNGGIFAQRFNNDGSKNGSEFQVNTYSDGDQEHPSVALDSNGYLAITWASENQYSSNSLSDIYIKHYLEAPPNSITLESLTLNNLYVNISFLSTLTLKSSIMFQTFLKYRISGVI